MSEIKCRSEFRTNPDEGLTANEEFTNWVASLPVDAVLSPLTVDKGSQRDPWPVLVGLAAAWTEER